MSSFETQRVGPNDLALHREVIALYARAFEDPEHYQPDLLSDAYLTKVLSRDEFVELAAVSLGQVIGALSGYVLHKFEAERSEFYIYDLAVDKRFRRQGIATSLINAGKPVAREHGAHVMFVQAERGDAPAEALYASLGALTPVSSFDIDPHD